MNIRSSQLTARTAWNMVIQKEYAATTKGVLTVPAPAIQTTPVEMNPSAYSVTVTIEVVTRNVVNTYLNVKS